MTFEGCRLEGDILKIDFGCDNLIKPTLLETFYFNKEPDFNFMRLGYKGLEPTGLYEDNPERRQEEYVVEHGGLLPRSYWDQDISGYGEDGDEVRLSKEARLEAREVKDGHFLIVSKGSILNSIQYEDTKSDLAQKGRNSGCYREIKRKYG